MKIGDKVQIRTDLDRNKRYEGCNVLCGMEQYRGKIAIVKEVVNNRYHTLDIDNGNHYWTDEMLCSHIIGNKYRVINQRDKNFDQVGTLLSVDQLVPYPYRIQFNEGHTDVYNTSEIMPVDIDMSTITSKHTLILRNGNYAHRGDNTNIDGNISDYDIMEIWEFDRLIWKREEEQILDEKEKEYLSIVLKPFMNDIEYIVKDEYIIVELNDNDSMSFPNLKDDRMYAGMEENKKYTLKELGLK